MTARLLTPDRVRDGPDTGLIADPRQCGHDSPVNGAAVRPSVFSDFAHAGSFAPVAGTEIAPAPQSTRTVSPGRAPHGPVPRISDVAVAPAASPPRLCAGCAGLG